MNPCYDIRFVKSPSQIGWPMGTIKITLAVDRSRNRVLFADAGSDFVEILLSFLKLPLSAVQSIAGLTSCGCLTKLRDSVNHLTDSELLKVGLCHGMLLAPTHADEFNVSVKHC